MARKVKGFDVHVGRLSHRVTHAETAMKHEERAFR
jgi:hypothetical protein